LTDKQAKARRGVRTEGPGEGEGPPLRRQGLRPARAGVYICRAGDPMNSEQILTRKKDLIRIMENLAMKETRRDDRHKRGDGRCKSLPERGIAHSGAMPLGRLPR